jgi:hypothetical protein
MKAMHITFICQEKDIVILIESGGINSFIDVQVIKEINASIEKTTMLAVRKCDNIPNSYSLCKGKSLVGCFFFLIKLNFFYSLFFSHLVKKNSFREKSCYKLYKVIKIKRCEETIVYPYILHCE